MKKITTLFILLVAGLLNFVSSAVSFTLVIDDPSRISVTTNGTELTMVAGENPISVDEYTYVNFTATEGNGIKSIVNSASFTTTVDGEKVALSLAAQKANTALYIDWQETAMLLNTC